MEQTETYKKALEFATKKHAGQVRKEGIPYVTHPIAVAEMLKEQGFGEKYQIAGLFHDLLEDTDATEEEILTLSDNEVLTAVKCLTKQDGYVMADYISAIRQNEIAFRVKAADRLHNLRCAVVASESFKKRYILESIEWYTDFSPEIPKAIKELSKTLETPMENLAF